MWPPRLGTASLFVVPVLLLTACGAEEGVPERAPPVSAPAETWDLSRLPDPGPVLWLSTGGAPKEACGKPVQVIDTDDTPVGWLAEGNC